MSRIIGVLKYEQSECFKLAIREIFQVRNDFFEIETGMAFISAAYSFPQPKMTVEYLFITNVVPRKVEKERKVRKSEERKVKNKGKYIFSKKYLVK